MCSELVSVGAIWTEGAEKSEAEVARKSVRKRVRIRATCCFFGSDFGAAPVASRSLAERGPDRLAPPNVNSNDELGARTTQSMFGVQALSATVARTFEGSRSSGRPSANPSIDLSRNRKASPLGMHDAELETETNPAFSHTSSPRKDGGEGG